MSFYIEDNRLSPQNIEEFNKKGWTLVDLKLSPNILKMATLGLKQMKKDAINNSYKPKRIYYDHLFTNNIAAIELPFNKDICNVNVKNLFKKAKIGSLVKSLMNWENPCCDLSRLFCMGDFKYRGNWHRDYNDEIDNIHLDSSFRDIILVGIYLLPQKGFRLLKKDFDYKGINSIIKNKSIDKTIASFGFPLSPPKNSYYEINGTIGTALFFDPLLIHQGSNYGPRFDFHMKFHNSKKGLIHTNSFQDFGVINILKENYQISAKGKDKIENLELSKIPSSTRSSLLNRFSNSIDYIFCLRRIAKILRLMKSKDYFLLKNEGWEIDFFSNSHWQD